MVTWRIGTMDAEDSWTRIPGSPEFEDTDQAAEWSQEYFKTKPDEFEAAWRGEITVAFMRVQRETDDDSASGDKDE